MSTDTIQSKDDILRAFRSLRKDFEGQETLIITKAEEAERAKDDEVVSRAATYTVEAIVKDLADQQLNFSASLDSLSGKLVSESEKLDELRRAIKVETKRIAMLANIKVAAEALEILTHENAERLKEFETESNDTRQELEDKISDTREARIKEQTSHEESITEFNARQVQDRALREEEFLYDLERKRKIETDSFEESRRQLNRQIAETTANKEKDWSEREAVLTTAAEEIEELRAKVDGFPEELETKAKEARSEAISSTNKDAKIELSLLEKDISASVEVSELKISSLEATIAEQQATVTELEAKLQRAQKDADQLAREAISRGRVAALEG